MRVRRHTNATHTPSTTGRDLQEDRVQKHGQHRQSELCSAFAAGGESMHNRLCRIHCMQSVIEVIPGMVLVFGPACCCSTQLLNERLPGSLHHQVIIQSQPLEFDLYLTLVLLLISQACMTAWLMCCLVPGHTAYVTLILLCMTAAHTDSCLYGCRHYSHK